MRKCCLLTYIYSTESFPSSWYGSLTPWAWTPTFVTGFWTFSLGNPRQCQHQVINQHFLTVVNRFWIVGGMNWDSYMKRFFHQPLIQWRALWCQENNLILYVNRTKEICTVLHTDYNKVSLILSLSLNLCTWLKKCACWELLCNSQKTTEMQTKHSLSTSFWVTCSEISKSFISKKLTHYFSLPLVQLLLS